MFGFTIIIVSLGSFCLLFLIFVLLNILLTKLKINNIKKQEKVILQRHKENKYTQLEADTIRNICTEELFNTYYFYCPNDNTWADLATKIDAGEKIIDITTNQVEVKKFLPSIFLICSVFLTNKGRLLIYSLDFNKIYKANAKSVITFSLNDISDIYYIINPELTNALKYSVPARAVISLKENKKVKITNTTAQFIENIREMLFKTGLVENSNEEFELSQPERISNKLDKLLQQNKISAEKYKELKKRAVLSTAQIRKKLWEERFYS